MKCKQVISTWHTSGNGQKVNEIVCSGEMKEVCVLVRDVEPDGPLSLTLRKVALYQCHNCKTIAVE